MQWISLRASISFHLLKARLFSRNELSLTFVHETSITTAVRLSESLFSSLSASSAASSA
jgi:hypothetical protein